MNAVVAVTVMHEGAGFGRGVVAVSACMSGTHGLCVFSSTADVLETSVVRDVGGVCGMCLAWACVGGEGVI